MKRSIVTIALMLAATTAHAGIIATINNEAGSTIKLTDGKCDIGTKSHSKKGWSALFATAGNGRTIEGCWFWNSDVQEIIAVYEDGSTYAYPSQSITITDYFRKTYGKAEDQ